MESNKVALIIGGSGGIGHYLVQQFAKSGYDVSFTYLKESDRIDSLAQIESISGFQVDVTKESEVENLSRVIEEKYGHLTALIYAAGTFEDGVVENISLSSWNHVIDVNLTGAFLTTKYMLPLLRKSGNGRILYAGSVMGESGIYGSSSYAVTKAGLIALAKSVGLENARKNVTANVVSFGYIDAGMTNRVSGKVLDSALKSIPMRKLGDPVDVAKVMVDLCSEHTNYISGQVIRLNGMLYV